MPLTTKQLEVRPSAGQGVADGQVHALLRQYCTALNRTLPTYFVATGDQDEDTATIHQCAVAKAALLEANAFGLAMDWRPTSFHTVDPSNSSVWTANTVNTIGVIYDVGVGGGVTQQLCVTNL